MTILRSDWKFRKTMMSNIGQSTVCGKSLHSSGWRFRQGIKEGAKMQNADAPVRGLVSLTVTARQSGSSPAGAGFPLRIAGLLLAVTSAVATAPRADAIFLWPQTPPADKHAFVIGVGGGDAILHPDRDSAVLPGMGAKGTVILRHGTQWHVEQNFHLTVGNLVYRNLDSYQLRIVNDWADYGEYLDLNPQMAQWQLGDLPWLQLCKGGVGGVGGVYLLGSSYAVRFASDVDGYYPNRWFNGRLWWNTTSTHGAEYIYHGEGIGWYLTMDSGRLECFFKGLETLGDNHDVLKYYLREVRDRFGNRAVFELTPELAGAVDLQDAHYPQAGQLDRRLRAVKLYNSQELNEAVYTVAFTTFDPVDGPDDSLGRGGAPPHPVLSVNVYGADLMWREDPEDPNSPGVLQGFEFNDDGDVYPLNHPNEGQPRYSEDAPDDDEDGDGQADEDWGYYDGQLGYWVDDYWADEDDDGDDPEWPNEDPRRDDDRDGLFNEDSLDDPLVQKIASDADGKSAIVFDPDGPGGLPDDWIHQVQYVYFRSDLDWLTDDPNAPDDVRHTSWIYAPTQGAWESVHTGEPNPHTAGIVHNDVAPFNTAVQADFLLIKKIVRHRPDPTDSSQVDERVTLYRYDDAVRLKGVFEPDTVRQLISDNDEIDDADDILELPDDETVYFGTKIDEDGVQVEAQVPLKDCADKWVTYYSGEQIGSKAKAFSVESGLVVFEAEDYSRRTTGSADRQWQLVAGDEEQEGCKNGLYMQALPDEDLEIDDSEELGSITARSPRLSYQVAFNIDSETDFYLWVRARATDTSANSVHFGLDGTCLSSNESEAIEVPTTDTNGMFVWSSLCGNGTRPTITIGGDSSPWNNQEDLHIVNLWMREDGVEIDRLLLTDNDQYVPPAPEDPPEEGSSSSSFDYDYDTPGYQVQGDDNHYLIDASNYQQKQDGSGSGPEGQVIDDIWFTPHDYYNHNATVPGNTYSFVIAGIEDTDWPKTGCEKNATDNGNRVDLEDVDADGAPDSIESRAPMLTYLVNFTSAGEYYLWWRGSAPNGSGDSFHYGLNGACISSDVDNAAAVPHPHEGCFFWRWANQLNDGSCAQLTVPEGLAELNIWMREDGVWLDKFILTTAEPNSQNPDPAWCELGPDETTYYEPLPEYLVGAPEANEYATWLDVPGDKAARVKELLFVGQVPPGLQAVKYKDRIKTMRLRTTGPDGTETAYYRYNYIRVYGAQGTSDKFWIGIEDELTIPETDDPIPEGMREDHVSGERVFVKTRRIVSMNVDGVVLEDRVVLNPGADGDLVHYVDKRTFQVFDYHIQDAQTDYSLPIQVNTESWTAVWKHTPDDTDSEGLIESYEYQPDSWATTMVGVSHGHGSEAEAEYVFDPVYKPAEPYITVKRYTVYNVDDDRPDLPILTVLYPDDTVTRDSITDPNNPPDGDWVRYDYDYHDPGTDQQVSIKTVWHKAVATAQGGTGHPRMRRYYFDSSGRLTKVEQGSCSGDPPAKGFVAGTVISSEYEYDGWTGRARKRTDYDYDGSITRQTEYEYNSLGQPTQITVTEGDDTDVTIIKYIPPRNGEIEDPQDPEIKSPWSDPHSYVITHPHVATTQPTGPIEIKMINANGKVVETRTVYSEELIDKIPTARWLSHVGADPGSADPTDSDYFPCTTYAKTVTRYGHVYTGKPSKSERVYVLEGAWQEGSWDSGRYQLPSEPNDEALTELYEYDYWDMPERLVAEDGQRERILYDTRKRITKIFHGTCDSDNEWHAPKDPGPDDDNMYLLEQRIYRDHEEEDYENEENYPDDAGKLIRIRRFASHAEPACGWPYPSDCAPGAGGGAGVDPDALAWDTEYLYDWRGRVMAERHYAQSVQGGSHKYTTTTTYDNQDRAVVVADWATDTPPDPMTFSQDSPSTILASNPLTLRIMWYDSRGRMYRQRVYDVSEPDGSVYTETFYYRDDLDRTVKIRSDGGGVHKTVYDGLNRRIEESYWAEDGGGDILVSKTEWTYDVCDNVIKQVTTEANHDGAGTISYYVFHWYDDYRRLKATLDCGTGASEDVWTQADTAPDWHPLDDDVPSRASLQKSEQLTEYTYDDAGRVTTVTDPEEKVTRYNQYDALGRVLLMTEDDGGLNRRTAYLYDSQGRLAKIATGPFTPNDPITETLFDDLPDNGEYQVTEYKYGNPRGDDFADGEGAAVLAVNEQGGLDQIARLPGAISAVYYPDPDTGLPSSTAAVQFQYYIDGQVATRTDGRGLTLTYQYQDLPGKLTAIRTGDWPEDPEEGGPPEGMVGTSPTTVRHLTYDYDALGRLTHATTRSLEQEAINQVTFTYNGLGGLSEEGQSHGGEVYSWSPKFVYDWQKPTDGHHLRLAKITYPSNNFVTYDYSHPEISHQSTINNQFDRIGQIAVGYDTTTVGTIAQYDFNGLDRLVCRTHPGGGENDAGNDTRLDLYGGTSGQYAGLDRFGRIKDLAHLDIIDPQNPIDVTRHQYKYDKVGNPTSIHLDPTWTM